MPSRQTETSIDKIHLEKFLTRVSNLAEVIDSQTQSVAYFGYYLSEEVGEIDITPKKIRACFEAAAMPAPTNISTAMRRSEAFVSTSTGMKLHRDMKTRIEKSLTPLHLEVNTQASIAATNSHVKA